MAKKIVVALAIAALLTITRPGPGRLDVIYPVNFLAIFVGEDLALQSQRDIAFFLDAALPFHVSTACDKYGDYIVFRPTTVWTNGGQ